MIARQLVDRQQDDGEQADAEHDQVQRPPSPAGGAGVGEAQQTHKSAREDVGAVAVTERP